MGIDAIVKRYFLLILGALVLLALYFQGRGISDLAASALMPSEPPALPPARAVRSKQTSTRSVDGEPILARNAFDSSTGPLDGSQVELAMPEPTVDPNKDPGDDPLCESAKLLMITYSDDPSWSFAVLVGPEGKSVMRRAGDEIAGHTVHFVGWDRIWLLQGAQRCQLPLGAGQAPSGGSRVREPDPGSDAPKPSRHALPPEIASKIKKISDTEYEVERSVVDHVLENQADFMKSARIVPEKEGNKVVGVRMFGIRADSLLGTLGLQNGDRLQSINGFDISNPEKALEAYAKLRTADSLSIAVNRKGKNVTQDIKIK